MQIGDKIVFDKYKWRVLDVQNDKALLLCDKVLEIRPYHKDFIDITWEQCTLRQFLNSDFFNLFNLADRSRIVKSTVSNAKNPKYGTDGGVDTSDYVFLLSVGEVIQYFGYFWQYYSEWKYDPYKNARRVKNASGVYSWWWLRSTGIHNKNAVYINGVGRVFVGGDSVHRSGGVRPALWLRT